tara:strand:+ start:57 stop:281 length:225 start_codon:yes stop_codon:yes gene_type:complete
MPLNPQSMITEVRTVDSPCVGICNIDFDATDICQGCGRSINEIANWSVYTDEDKIVVNEQATKRMKEISFDRGF